MISAAETIEYEMWLRVTLLFESQLYDDLSSLTYHVHSSESKSNKLTRFEKLFPTRLQIVSRRL